MTFLQKLRGIFPSCTIPDKDPLVLYLSVVSHLKTLGIIETDCVHLSAVDLSSVQSVHLNKLLHATEIGFGFSCSWNEPSIF